jgi:hypothetical protein
MVGAGAAMNTHTEDALGAIIIFACIYLAMFL